MLLEPHQRMISVDILAKDMSVLYHIRRMERQTDHRNVARSESYDLATRSKSYDLWERRWDDSAKDQDMA